LATKRARELRQSVSKTEARLWLHLSGSKLGVPFRRQHPIGPYFADYFCRLCRLVVEVDGPDHDIEHDARRDTFMRARGLSVLRFGVQTVSENLEGVIDAIYRAVQERRPTPSLPPPFRGRTRESA
jgi:very-short-patch-repair endonuclease